MADSPGAAQSDAQYLQSVANADSWDGMRAIVKAGPATIGTGVIDLLMKVVQHAESGKDPQSIGYQAMLETLIRCNEIGIDAAFDEGAREVVFSTPETRGYIEELFERALRALDEAEAAGKEYLQKPGAGPAGDRLIASLEEALRLLRRTQPLRGVLVGTLNRCGGAYLNRYGAANQTADLESADACYRQALRRSEPEGWERAACETNVFGVLVKQFVAAAATIPDARARFLEEAMYHFRAAVENCAEYCDVVDAWDFWAEQLGHCRAAVDDRSILDDCIEVRRQLVRYAEPDRTRLPAYLHHLASDLYRRSRIFNSHSDLDESLRIFDRVWTGFADERSNDSFAAANYALALLERARGGAGRTDLDRAAQVIREVLQKPQQKAEHRLRLLNTAETVFQTRYENLATQDDFTLAVGFAEEGLRIAPADSIERVLFLANLGRLLLSDFRSTGVLDTLNRAIALIREALAAGGDRNPYRANQLNSLGDSLREHYSTTKSRSSLVSSTQHLEEALQLAENSPAVLARVLTNLANNSREFWRLDHDPGQLEKAIAYVRRAIGQTHPASSNRPVRLVDLSAALLDRYQSAKNPADLIEAAEHLRAARELSSSHSVLMPAILNNLGSSLRQLYDLEHEPALLGEAIEVYQQACRLGVERSPQAALNASQVWGEWAGSRESWQEAVRAYEYGMRALQSLLEQQASAQDKQSWLKHSTGLASSAAIAFAMTDQPERAAEALEHGRAVLLSEALRSREFAAPGDSEAAGLLRQYREARNRLSIIRGEAPGPSDNPRLIHSLAACQSEVAGLLARIRAVPGYERFSVPPSAGDIVQAAQSTPIVYVTVSGNHSLAIIVHPGGPARSRFLSATEAGLRETLTEYVRALPDSSDKAERIRWMAALDKTLEWLWTHIMRDVVADLGPSEKAVLIPFGLLALLPLQAAWTADEESPSGRRYAGSKISFSYAPNALSLVATARAAKERSFERALIIYDPAPVRARPIPAAAFEAAIVASKFTNPRIIGRERATVKEVAGHLADFDAVHLACHGNVDYAEPLNSGLLMARNEMLSLEFIFQVPLRRLRLAVLSACNSGLPGLETPDEVISLPAGFIQAGAAGVTSSLWAVSDESTMVLMARYYHELREKERPPAIALAKAQEWLRSSTNEHIAAFFRSYSSRGETGGSPADISRLEAYFSAKRADLAEYDHPYFWAAFVHFGA